MDVQHSPREVLSGLRSATGRLNVSTPEEAQIMTTGYAYPPAAKIIHLGMAAFGIAAYATSELTDDAWGYLLHAYLGLSLAGFMAARIIGGLSGRPALGFSGWSPFSRRQWSLVLDDVRRLIRLDVPERGMHEGLAGVTQAAGIALFAWMGATGTGMFLIDEGAYHDVYEALEELHEVGETLIPLYLLLHVGSVVVHALAGHPIWRRMWTLRDGS